LKIWRTRERETERVKDWKNERIREKKKLSKNKEREKEGKRRKKERH
jgi:hypothetical protein